MPKIVGRYVSFPRATESLPKTTGIISSRCGTLLFIFSAPCPKDITIIIAATPITMPRIVKRDRDLWVWSPDIAALSVYLKIIFRIRCSCGGCRPVCRFQLFRPTDGLLSARVLLCKFHELSILLCAYPQY